MAYDFDKIARTYDRLNRVMTFGLDRYWRRRAVRELSALYSPLSVLDVACGTGDMAISLAEQSCTVTGVDISEEMLEIAKQKTASATSHLSHFVLPMPSICPLRTIPSTPLHALSVCATLCIWNRVWARCCGY